jgi:Neuraminidase (sialidase)
VEAGGVPTVIQDIEGRLIAAFQWFTCESAEAFDKVAVSISEDEGETWSDPELIEIEDFPEGYQRPFDPTLALLEDGRIRIYFTSNANGMTTFSGDTNIYSAISEDGIHYTFEEGVRFSLEEAAVYDSAVGYRDGLWHIITPKNTETPKAAYHATSEDGLTFEQQDDIALDTEVNWTGNFLAKDDGLYFYGTPDGQTGNWWTMTSDGETWTDAEFLTTHGGDPAVVCIKEDRCLMITVQMPNQSAVPAPTPLN